MTRAPGQPLDDLAQVDAATAAPQTAFAVLQRLQVRRTQKGDPFLDFELGDLTRTLPAKIWKPTDECIADLQRLPLGTAIKAQFQTRVYQGRIELDVGKIRAATADDRCDPARIFGPTHALVRELACSNIVVDIETVPTTDLRKAPSTIAQTVSKAAERMDAEEAKVMGLSPFFGQVVSLAVGDADADADDMAVTVLVVLPKKAKAQQLPSWVRPVTESELLHTFWGLAALAETVITFNGTNFDVPYLVARSLLGGVPARVDLLANRWSTRPHCDLYQVVTQGSRTMQPATLDVVCWSLGIDSPKGEMDGSMVAPAYLAGEIERIAAYNAADVRATVAVYQRVRELILRYR